MSNPNWCYDVSPGDLLITTEEAQRAMGAPGVAEVEAIRHIRTKTADFFCFTIKCKRPWGGSHRMERCDLGIPWFVGKSEG